VSNASKNAGLNNPAKAGNLAFEEALKKLETIVEAMESQDLPLEALLAKYEEGTRLAKMCQDKLSEADLKIQQLEKNASGEMKLKPVQSLEDSGE
jgi:exodeoxyribonuclease VII small subunit